MAYNPDKIFGEIQKILEAAPAEGNPSRTEICQRLVDERIVRSMGTAHKYVGAFFAADAINAEVLAPAVELSVLPDRVQTSFMSLLEAAGRLKDEFGWAIDDLTQRSSASFGKMMTAHDAAQQAEIIELATELEGIRREHEVAQAHLLEERAHTDELEAVVSEKDRALADANAMEMELRQRLAAQEEKTAFLAATLDARDKVIASLESERAVWLGQLGKGDEDIRLLKEKLDRDMKGSELKATERVTEAVTEEGLQGPSFDGETHKSAGDNDMDVGADQPNQVAVPPPH